MCIRDSRSFKGKLENTATPEPPNTDMEPKHGRNWAPSRRLWGNATTRNDIRVKLRDSPLPRSELHDLQDQQQPKPGDRGNDAA